MHRKFNRKYHVTNLKVYKTSYLLYNMSIKYKSGRDMLWQKVQESIS